MPLAAAWGDGGAQPPTAAWSNVVEPAMGVEAASFGMRGVPPTFGVADAHSPFNMMDGPSPYRGREQSQPVAWAPVLWWVASFGVLSLVVSRP